MERITYTIKTNRLRRSYGEGIAMDSDANLYLSEETGTHRLYLKSIDGAEADAEWGRFSFHARLQDEQVLYVYAFASNDTETEINGEKVSFDRFLTSENIPNEAKKAMILQNGGKRFVGKDDMLFYDLKGRYLYLGLEVLGEGAGLISRMKVERGSDAFMEAFPEVYRQDKNFFRRYLSIYNSIYNDFDDKIDRLPDLLDTDQCPGVLLPVYAGWMGIDVQGDFMEEEALRTLVKEAYILNRAKGTKACLQRILEIVLDEPAVILEENQIKKYGDIRVEQGDVFTVTVLIKKQLTENERYQLTYLLEQFLPVRCKLKLECFEDSGMLDSRVYLDMNARVSEADTAVLDDYMEMDGYIILEE